MSSLKRPASTSKSGEKKKANLKQGNLFSFFGKKPASSTTTSSTPKPAAAPPNTSTTPPTARITQQSQATPSATKAPLNEKWKKVEVGARVAVFWPDDQKYYEATVTSKRGDAGTFTLSYDDGEVERIDLSMEKFRLLERKPKESSSNKKRRIAEESEEEFEFDDDEASVESDSSEYKQGSEAEDDDEDEAQEWMVTDDDEDDSHVAKKKKNKAPPPKKPRYQVTAVQAPSNFSATKSPKTSSTPQSLVTPHSKAKRTTQPSTSQSQPTVTPLASRVTPSPSLTSSSAKSQPLLKAVKGAVNPGGSHMHNHLKFIQNPKDSHGRTPDDPLYDCHTLKVDYRELDRENGKLTPAQQQWWELKANYYDSVLFFKTGKFYELYHMDADIGVKCLDFIYMKGHIAHSGFPEISYGTMAERLVRAGYKVARVEQTETPDMLKERKKKTRGSKPKVVSREVCSILTMGTRTYCYMDDDTQLLQEGGNGSAGPLLAIREVLLESDAEPGKDDASLTPVCEYGITLVDAVRATVTIGQFADDVLRSRMNTLLTAFEPSEILVEGGEQGASSTLLSLVRAIQATSGRPCRVERIQPKETFPKSTAVDPAVKRKMERNTPTLQPWDVKETLDELHRRGYYPRASREEKDRKSTSRWPKVLQAVVEGNAELAMSSFGAALFYLQRNLIDEDILGMNIVKAYVPPASSGTEKTGSPQVLTNVVTQQDLEEDGTDNVQASSQSVQFVSDETMARENEINHLSLDGTTLQNLEVLTNAQTHTQAGSLWSKINYTKTPHGNRLLRAWLLRPLFRKADIDRRTDAVEELVSGGAAVSLSEAQGVLAKVGDLERLLSRIHSMGAGANPSENAHPNERAVLYEAATHTKRKVGDFSKVLNGLKQATQIPELFAGVDIQSGLLLKLVRSINNGGCFPEMTNELDWFFDNFDCEQAAQGSYEPSRGVDDTYDEACDTIERIRRDLDDYKDEMCSNELRSSSARSQWKYINTKAESKDKYLIELPASIRVPDSFVVKGKRGSGVKQINKYRTPVVGQLVEELERALEIQKEGRALGMQLVFAKFDSKRNLWAAAAQATAMLDALGSLAQASARSGYTRASILECPPDQNPSIKIVQGRHPCVDFTHNGGQFIPNDLDLGTRVSSGEQGLQSSRVLLLSGPNMGGKSTLLRQTSLILILAQMGCFVPASECAVTPIDRIYTRLGASDRILLGQSTFFVELAETASALRGASRRSLVIMDELGRGTSTFDGASIASASVHHLVERNRCLTLFATHYHSLLEEWVDEPSVRLGHMECLVEGGGSSDDVSQGESRDSEDDKDHNVTFLYTLGDGACPKSFGINVARLAGLPEEVLRSAKRVSSRFENEMSGIGSASDSKSPSVIAIKNAIQSGSIEEVEALWDELQSRS